MEAPSVAAYNSGLANPQKVVSRKPDNEAAPNSSSYIRGDGAADNLAINFTNPL